MAIYQLVKSVSLAVVGLGFVSGAVLAGDDLDQYKEDYPGCVAIVKNQLLLFAPENQVAMMPHLMEACMSGRQIGEKRTKQMYDIPKEKKPKKQSNFKIKVVPPSSLQQDPFDVQY